MRDKSEKSLVLTKFRKIEEDEQENVNNRCTNRSDAKCNHEKVPAKTDRKLTRSLSFASLLPIGSKRGKLKISKFVGDKTKLNCVEENSELTSFCNSLKRSTTFKDKILKKDTVAEANMRRLSLVCNEIDKFEREFVEPVRKSASSLSLATSATNSTSSSMLAKKMRKHNSVNLLSSKISSVGNPHIGSKYYSTESVTSGYNSGAFSRESTPDLSLSSSLTEPPIRDEENNFLIENSKKINEDKSEKLRGLFSSTPRKPLRSISDRVTQRNGKIPLVRRSHTTIISDLELENIFFRTAPAVISSVGCSEDCKALVTVNGFCYH